MAPREDLRRTRALFAPSGTFPPHYLRIFGACVKKIGLLDRAVSPRGAFHSSQKAYFPRRLLAGVDSCLKGTQAHRAHSGLNEQGGQRTEKIP